MLKLESLIEVITSYSNLPRVSKPIYLEPSSSHDEGEVQENIIKRPVPTYPSNYVRYSSSSSFQHGNTEEPKNKRAGRRKLHRVSDHFSLKYENVRQSIIRFFKRNMRKLLKTVKPALQSNSNMKPKQIQRIKTLFLKHFYNLFQCSTFEDSEIVFDTLVSMDSHTYFDSKIGGIQDNFKSCNDAYVRWFFNNPSVLSLYRIHDKYCQLKESYEQILKIKKDGISYLERTKLYNFISNIPEEYREK